MKRRIKLTESDLRNIVKESVKRIINEEYGIDFEDTLNCTKNAIIKKRRQAVMDEGFDKSKTEEKSKNTRRRNVTRIKIIDLADMGRNKELIMNKVLMLRHARNVGDEEVVNNTQLSALENHPKYIKFDIVE